jgi:hypothetical protein
MLAACGGMSASSFQEQRIQIRCEARARCCGLNFDLCVQAFENATDVMFTETAIQRGLVNYDAGAAPACLNALTMALADCNAPLVSFAIPECANVLAGAVPAGGQCDQRITTCVDGQYCLGNNPPNVTGACTRLAQFMESCLDVPCAPGLGCGQFHICVMPQPDGTACVRDGECVNQFCSGGVCGERMAWNLVCA